MTEPIESDFRNPNARANQKGDMTGDSPFARKKKSRRKAGAQRGRRRRLKMEGLEGRQLLAASIAPTGFNVPDVDADLFAAQAPRNIGTVTSFVYNEDETASARGFNDTINDAELLPLGTRASQEDTVDVFGSMTYSLSGSGFITTDIDTYAMDLRAGDILDIAVQGAGSNFTTFYPNGQIWFGTDSNIAGYPPASPLMTAGNAVGAQVVPEDGRYYVTVAPTFGSGNYTLGLRAYRPVLEQLPIGSQQIVYLDFDGGIYANSNFGDPQTGVVRFLGTTDSLNLLGIQTPRGDEIDAIIDYVMVEVEEQLHSIATNGTNGDYDATGTPGEYGITVLNSRDHADPGNHPLVTRVMLGSEVGNPPGIIGNFGVSPSGDIGNFDPSEIVVGFIEAHITAAQTFPISAAETLINAVSQQLAGTITHEIAHSFGLEHTDGTNFTDSIIDQGGARLDTYLQAVGNDGIFGTFDDITPEFVRDWFDQAETLFFGYQESPAALSHVLSTGTVGSTITGRAFNDGNRNGNGSGDPGLPGVTVFADLDGDGELDPTEPYDITGSNGAYSLNVANGPTYSIVAIAPEQFAATSSTIRLAAGGASGINFGFSQVIPDVTGIKFADVNGNGFFDETESGIGGVYIYLDLDGDDRPDLGEPSDVTAADGSYSINFPGAGTYTIREVVEPGFIQTFPSTGEHVVVYDGVALTDNYNFGNLPSRDYGDAPDSYRTSVATNGPSHGISNGLGLGELVDREVDGFPSLAADGDDANNLDDEDGVRLLSPLGPGVTTTIEVTTRNDSGSSAFLQGWIDFNNNNTFDSNEKVFNNVSLGAGTHNLEIDVPANAVVGTTYARFRYSPTANLGVGGEADVGEVEDYQFEILTGGEIANDDEFTVPRNSLSNALDVLANDFESDLTQLTIVRVNENGTEGSVSITQAGRSISYTPPNGFTGRDVFQYVVQDQLNNEYTATVVVNVNFQSNVPIAVDDTFDVPQGSSNRALNVLDNDVPSVAGGLTITSVTAGDQGGQVFLEGGGQTIRYTPQPGFAGTEQFIYSIEDANGVVSTAQVTVNSQPGAMLDDLVDFTIGIYDAIDTDKEITDIQVGQEFLVRVFVQELNSVPLSPDGVASAFLDLLYTDELVSTQDTTGNPLGFDIEFGPNFRTNSPSGGGVFQIGDASTPGLVDDVGAVQPISLDFEEHTEPAELFTIRMNAVSPGIASFRSDPADAAVAETILIGEDTALTPSELRLGRTELEIFPASDNFASAVDDAFVNGLDSNGQVIAAGSQPNTLDVLANDNFGPTGEIREFGIEIAPSLGNVTINDNGTPNFLGDDTINYFANVGADGFDRFTYVIVSNDGVRSTAEVTMAIGDADDDDIVRFTFDLVDQFGSPITSVSSGETFGVEIYVEDIRQGLDNTAVFAGYMDVLYDQGLITPVETPSGSRYDFDVDFDDDFDATAGSGTAIKPGIINEFGTLLSQSESDISDPDDIIEPNLMATIYFTAGNVSSTTSTTVISSPADSFPFHDTLLLNRNTPVPVSQINFNELIITITPGGPQQNPALAEDVNNDGVVTPSDALTVINALARGGEGEFGSDSGGLYTDVNGDSITTALDALYVINHLANMVALGSGEGESVLADPPASGAGLASDEGVREEVFADLSQQTKLVASDVDAGVALPVDQAASLADTDDEEDDLLALLADDQSGLLA